MPEEDVKPKRKKAAPKKATTRKKAAPRSAPPTVTKEKVMVSVDIEDKGLGGVARYSGLFFVFSGAILSLFSLGGLYVETHEFVLQSEFESNERTFAFLVDRHQAANVAAAVAAAQTTASSTEAATASSTLMLDTEAEGEATVAPEEPLPAEEAAPTEETPTPVAPQPFIEMQETAAAPTSNMPQFFSQNMSGLITSFVIVMLGLALLLMGMYLSRRRPAALEAAPPTPAA